MATRRNSVHINSMVLRFEKWAVMRLAQGFSLEDAAYDLATSKRSLGRHIQTALGKSPLEFFQELRIARAVDVLKTSNTDIDINEIARQVGYSNGATLRNLLRRHLNQTVRDIRHHDHAET